MTQFLNIAVWSGPRNLSTAMLYAFGNRPDCEAWDEPFYAAYLAATGADHPMRNTILASQPNDPANVAAACATPPARHRYMKHMPHHMVQGFPLDWAASCVNVHLLRHPARVIASYSEKRENPTLEDIGFAQQAALFDAIGGLVIDSFDIRATPRAALSLLCAEIGLPFSEAMLSWPAGPKPFDGAWATHWYNAVHRSVGFAGPEGPLPQLSGEAAKLCAAALPHYETLHAKRIEIL